MRKAIVEIPDNPDIIRIILPVLLDHGLRIERSIEGTYEKPFAFIVYDFGHHVPESCITVIRGEELLHVLDVEFLIETYGHQKVTKVNSIRCSGRTRFHAHQFTTESFR